MKNAIDDLHEGKHFVQALMLSYNGSLCASVFISLIPICTYCINCSADGVWRKVIEKTSGTPHSGVLSGLKWF